MCVFIARELLQPFSRGCGIPEGIDRPQWLCPETWDLYLSSALSPQPMPGLYWRRTGLQLSSSYAGAWPWTLLIQTPTCRLTSSQASELPCPCGPAWLPLNLILTLTCGFVSQVGLEPPSSPWYTATWLCPAQVMWQWPNQQDPLPRHPGIPLSTTSPREPLALGVPCDTICVAWLLCLQCCKGRVPGGRGSQPEETVKDPDGLPWKQTGKKLPLDLVFPEAQLMVVAVAGQITLVQRTPSWLTVWEGPWGLGQCGRKRGTVCLVSLLKPCSKVSECCSKLEFPISSRQGTTDRIIH